MFPHKHYLPVGNIQHNCRYGPRYGTARSGVSRTSAFKEAVSIRVTIILRYTRAKLFPKSSYMLFLVLAACAKVEPSWKYLARALGTVHAGIQMQTRCSRMNRAAVDVSVDHHSTLPLISDPVEHIDEHRSFLTYCAAAGPCVTKSRTTSNRWKPLIETIKSGRSVED